MYYSNSLAVYERTYPGVDHPAIAMSLRRLGSAYLALSWADQVGALSLHPAIEIAAVVAIADVVAAALVVVVIALVVDGCE